MTKNEINQIIADYVRHKLSPRKPERDRISIEYDRLKAFLQGRAFQNGSYARFTSTTPVNDLDVIYILPEETYKGVAEAAIQPSELDINNILETLALELKKEYGAEATIKVQPHSVGIYFGSDGDFSIDVVPAMPKDDGKFWVPESAHMTIKSRRVFYSSLRSDAATRWIISDPKGYIKQAATVDRKSNGNFRKTAKFVKKWKSKCKEDNEHFPLKSFHLELIVTRDYQKRGFLNCLEAIEIFYEELSANIEGPQFPDKADPSRYVDDYLKDMTESQKSLVVQMGTRAQEILAKIVKAERQSEVLGLLDELLLNKRGSAYVAAPSISITSPAYSKPYCERSWK